MWDYIYARDSIAIIFCVILEGSCAEILRWRSRMTLRVRHNDRRISNEVTDAKDYFAPEWQRAKASSPMVRAIRESPLRFANNISPICSRFHSNMAIILLKNLYIYVGATIGRPPWNYYHFEWTRNARPYTSLADKSQFIKQKNHRTGGLICLH